MSKGTIYPNLGISEFLPSQRMTLAFLVLGFVLSLSILSTSARAVIAFSNVAINASPAVAPLNSLNLSFTVFNITPFTATNNVSQITIVLQNASVSTGGAGTLLAFTLTNVTPAVSNTTATYNSTSTLTANGTNIVFSNTSTTTMFNGTNQLVTFSVNVSAPVSGNYTIYINSSLNGTTAGSNTPDNATTFGLQVVNGTITLTNASFVNYTYTNTNISTPMNFTATLPVPTGGGNVSNVTFQLFTNNLLTGTNSTGKQVLPNAPLTAIMLNVTNGTALTYTYILNTSGCGSTILSACANATNYSSTSLTAVLNVTPGATGLTLTVTPSASVSAGTATTVTGTGCPSVGSADISCSFSRIQTGGSTVTLSGSTETFTFSPSTTTTYTYATGGGANWTGASQTATVTVAQASSSGGTSGGGGGGAGGGTSTTPTATVTTGQVAISLPTVSPGTTAVTTVSNSDTRVTEIDLNVNNALSNAALTVNSVTSSQLPSAPTGTVYQSLNISKSGMQDADVATATIKFSVTKAWLTANNIDQTTVKLQRYVNGAWVALPTTKTSEDTTNVYFAGITPGFSYFTITGSQQGAAAPSTGGQNPTPTTTPTTTPTSSANTWLIIGVVVLIVLVAAWYYWSKRKKIYKR